MNNEETPIENIREEIVKISEPVCIYLISKKMDFDGRVTGIKYCIILPDNAGEICDLEEKLYTTIDSEVPFDLVLYKLSEWKKFITEVGSFAAKVHEKGTLIYPT
ncbi:MAG: hypothetical protein LBL93_06560 [Ruminococcus sp.]|jgi:hypothetical protein|nr:hypothetical protein [Ruminococcus sp.]